MELKLQDPRFTQTVSRPTTNLEHVNPPNQTGNRLGLLDLPPEVRVDIYRHLFRDSVLSLEPAFPAVSHCGLSVCACQFPYEVLDTCRSVRQEALGYLLASTTLSLASTSHKLEILPISYLSAIPRAVVMNVGQYLRRKPLNFDRFSSLKTLELRNIAVWCRYHEAKDLYGEDGEAIMINLAMFNIKRHGPELGALCASTDRQFNILLYCRFVISSANQETLDAILDIDNHKVVQRSKGAVIKDRNAWSGFY